MRIRQVSKYLLAGFLVHVLFVACNDEKRKEAVSRMVDAGMDVVVTMLPDAARPMLDGSAPAPDGTAPRDGSTLSDVFAPPVRDANAQTECSCAAPEDSVANHVGGFISAVGAATHDLETGPFFVTDVVMASNGSDTPFVNLYLVGAAEACGVAPTSDNGVIGLRGLPDTTTSTNGARFLVPAGQKLCVYVGDQTLFTWAGFRPAG